MACYYTPTGEESILYKQAINKHGEKNARVLMTIIGTPSFKNEFGDWKNAISISSKDGEIDFTHPIWDSMSFTNDLPLRDKVNELGEPKMEYIEDLSGFVQPKKDKKAINVDKDDVDNSVNKIVDDVIQVNNPDFRTEEYKESTKENNFNVLDTLRELISFAKDKISPKKLSYESIRMSLYSLSMENPIVKVLTTKIVDTDFYAMAKNKLGEDATHEQIAMEAVTMFIKSEHDDTLPDNEQNKAILRSVEKLFGKIGNMYKKVDLDALDSRILTITGLDPKTSTQFTRGYNAVKSDREFGDKLTGKKEYDSFIIQWIRDIRTLRDRKRRGSHEKNVAIDLEIEKLKGHIETLIDERNLSYVIETAEYQLSQLQSKLENFDSLTHEAKEDLYILSSGHLDTWTKINQFIEFTDEVGNNKLKEIAGKAKTLEDKINKLYEDYMTEYLTGDTTGMSKNLFAPEKDMSSFKSLFLDISNASQEVLKKVFTFVDKALYAAKKLTDDLHTEVDKRLKPVEEWRKANGLSKEQLWDLFAQVDDNGNKTGGYATKYKQEFYDTINALREKAKATNSKTDWKNYYNWLEENSNTQFDNEAYERDREVVREELSYEDGTFNTVAFQEWEEAHKGPKAPLRWKYITFSGKKDKWFDKKYAYIESIPELKEFYDFFIDVMKDRKSVLPIQAMQKANYIPELRKSLLSELGERKLSSLLSGMGNKFSNMFMVDVEDVKSKNVIDVEGREIRKVPVMMMDNRLDADKKTYDLGVIMKAFGAMSYTYQYKSMVADSVYITRDLLGQAKEKVMVQDSDTEKRDNFGKPINKVKDENNAIAALDYYIDSIIYDKKKIDEGVAKTRGKKRAFATSKLADQLIAYTRLLGMAWNVPAASFNAMLGITNNFIHSTEKTDYTEKQMMEAFGIMMKNTGTGGLTEQGKKIELLAKMFKVPRDIKDSSYDSEGLLGEKFSKISYIVQQKTEEFIQRTMMIAMLKNTDIGNGKSLWDAYDIKDGELSWNQDIKNKYHSLSNENYELYAKIQQALKDVHGNYDPDSPMRIKKTMYGRLIMPFRSWLPQYVEMRIGAERFDDRSQRLKKGRYTTLKDVFVSNNSNVMNNLFHTANVLSKQIITQLTFGATKFDDIKELSALDARNMRKNAAELIFLMSLALAGIMMKGLGKDDDDEDEDHTIRNFLVLAILRTQADLSFFMDPDSAKQIIRDIVPPVRTIDQMKNLFVASAKYIAGEDEIESGIYAGQSNLKRQVFKTTPYLGKIQSMMDLGEKSTEQLLPKVN